jgi:hypothetical protein
LTCRSLPVREKGRINPKAENFTPKSWDAVAYAREWALNQGNIQNPEIISNFEKNLSPNEREDIITVIQIMDFANKFNNTWSKPLKRSNKG